MRQRFIAVMLVAVFVLPSLGWSCGGYSNDGIDGLDPIGKKGGYRLPRGCCKGSKNAMMGSKG